MSLPVSNPASQTSTDNPLVAAVVTKLHFSHVSVVGGFFKASRDALDKLCRSLFDPSDPWLPTKPEVWIEWGQFSGDGKSVVAAPTFSFLILRVLVQSRSHPSARWTVLQAFTDCDWAMTHCREAFGFPVLLGTFHEIGGMTEVKTLVGSGSKSSYEVLATLQIAATEQDPQDPAQTDIPLVQLKQVRDAVDASRACFQALVRSKIVNDITGKPTRQSFTVTLNDYENLKLGADLGLTSGTAMTLPCFLASNFESDLQIESPPEPVGFSGRDGPPFLFRPGDPQFAPDYEFTNVELVGFRLPVERSVLQKLCDEKLNDPFPERGYRYVPADVGLIVECLNYPDLKADNPPLGSGTWPTDGTSQRELAFRMLVGRVRDGEQILRDPAIFCPFLFVDNAWSMISGREIIGYPKLMGHFDAVPTKGQLELCKITAAPPSISYPRNAEVITLDCRVEGTPIPIDDWLRERKAEFESAHEPPELLEQIEDAVFSWWGLADLQSGQTHAEHFVRSWLEGRALGYGLVQFKSFPQARDLKAPCYTELIEGTYTLRKFEVGVPLHSAALHFPDEDPFGLKTAFGFGSSIFVAPGSWYRATIDFRLRVNDPLG